MSINHDTLPARLEPLKDSWLEKIRLEDAGSFTLEIPPERRPVMRSAGTQIVPVVFGEAHPKYVYTMPDVTPWFKKEGMEINPNGEIEGTMCILPCRRDLADVPTPELAGPGKADDPDVGSFDALTNIILNRFHGGELRTVTGIRSMSDQDWSRELDRLWQKWDIIMVTVDAPANTPPGKVNFHVKRTPGLRAATPLPRIVVVDKEGLTSDPLTGQKVDLTSESLVLPSGYLDVAKLDDAVRQKQREPDILVLSFDPLETKKAATIEGVVKAEGPSKQGLLDRLRKRK